jgi:pre-rRNA-processing protein TSR3
MKPTWRRIGVIRFELNQLKSVPHFVDISFHDQARLERAKGMRDNERQDRPRVLVYLMEQDDPRKCTASLLVRKRLATPVRKLSDLHNDVVVLNPASPRFLLRSDANDCARHGIVAIDCSWEKANEVFMTRFRGANRKLPGLLAGNPVNYAKIGTLTTAEALSAALYIMGFRARAKELLSPFSWRRTFFDLNRELLEEYAGANSEESIAKIEVAFGLESTSSSS